MCIDDELEVFGHSAPPFLLTVPYRKQNEQQNNNYKTA